MVSVGPTRVDDVKANIEDEVPFQGTLYRDSLSPGVARGYVEVARWATGITWANKASLSTDRI